MNKYLSRYLLYYPVTLLHGEFIWKYLHEYESIQWKNSEWIRNYQNVHLNSLIRHAYKYVPYYKYLFDSIGITPAEINSSTDLKLLPTINKTSFVNKYDDLISRKYYFFKSKKTTGGSTGQAVTILKNSNALARERAATWRAYKWAGLQIGDKQARFWGVPLRTQGKILYKAVDFVSNRKRLSAFNINETNFRKYYQTLVNFKPKYFYGYVSIIAEFARFLLDNEYPSIANLKAVITTSEILDQNTRNLISTAFNANVYNEYGCGEVGSIAHECEYGNLHIMSDNLIVEIDNEHSNNNHTGELIITDLHNYAMPLIRYRLGDFATFSSLECKCGRGLPIIKKIHGRSYDIIVDPDNNKHHPEVLMYIFEELKTNNANIKQFQIIQKERDCLLIKLITSENYMKETENIICKIIHEKIHPSFKVYFHYTNKIEREASGKLRLVKSELH